MIVKILSSSAAFSGVRYNTNKIDSGKGELMLVKNFGALQGLSGLRPEDYRNYLKMISATNKAVTQPQFHAAISAEGRSYDKKELTEIAVQWLEKMGYSEQPYLVVFHKDTANNHVHVVTTRINRQGKKINSGFENIRAINNLAAVLGAGEQRNSAKDIEHALSYSFSTKAQFMMILETQGYKLTEKDGKLLLIKFGKVQADLSLLSITERLTEINGSTARRKQIAALLHKYAPGSDLGGLTGYLKQKHGIALVFHAKNGKRPYGYSIIDHALKTVYKGSEVLTLPALLELAGAGQLNSRSLAKAEKYKEPVSESFRRDYYKAMLKAAMENYPDIRHGLHSTGIGIYFHDNRYYLVDHNDKAFMPLEQLLGPDEYSAAMIAFAQSGELNYEIDRQYSQVPSALTSADVDDEAAHGRRRRKHKPKK